MSNLLNYEGMAFIDESGTYEAEITKCEQGYDPTKGCETYKYTFETASGVISKMYFDSPRAGFFLRVLAECCGLTTEQLSDFNSNMLIGKHCMIIVSPSDKTKSDGTHYMQIASVRKSETPYNSETPF